MIVFRTDLECSPTLIRVSQFVDLTFEARSHRRTDIEIKFNLPTGDTTTWSNGLHEITFRDVATRFFQNYSQQIEVIIVNNNPRTLIIDVTVTDLTDGTMSISSGNLNIS